MMTTIQNAKIESTMLGYEDHGIMTCLLYLNYGGAGQGFGGYALTVSATSEDRASGYAIVFIKRILDVVGVEKWEDLPGKYLRVETQSGKILQIGNVLEEKWFNPRELGTSWDEKSNTKS